MNVDLCPCGNMTDWEDYLGLDQRLYITCGNCGRDYDFLRILAYAVQHGARDEDLLRQWKQGEEE